MHPPSPRTRRFGLALLALLLGDFVAYRQPGAGPRIPSQRTAPPAAVVAQAAMPAALDANPGTAETPLAADQFLAFVTPPNAAALTADLLAPAREVRYVRINPTLIEGKQSPFWQPRDTGRLVLPLPDGREATVVILESESLGVRRFTSVGRIEGHPDSRAVFAYNEGFLNVHIDDPEWGEYIMRTATEELSQYYKTDPALGKGCGGEMTFVPDAAALEEIARRRTAESSPAKSGDPSQADAAPAEAAFAGTDVVVDLMIAYTQAVQNNLSGTTRTAAIQSACDSAVALLNSDLQSSLCQVRVRLVRIMEVTYAGDELPTFATDWQSDLLNRITSTTDGFMDEIHAARDQVGADLVCLLHKRGDVKSVGLAWRYDSTASSYSTYNALNGFAVVQYAFLSFEHVMSHEIGHNFGATHDRANSSSSPAFPYSYGYRYLASNGSRFRDIMAYDTYPISSYQFLPYFSTPLVTPSQSPGSPIGVTAGQTGEADVARTIDQTGFDIAAYRLQQQAPATNGTLYAVSTRAFVGTAVEQQLIGAFIVSGPAGSTKRMLLRGNGPSLGAFGVPNPLPNPKLTLYVLVKDVWVIVAENDDWGTNANAAAIATAGGTSAANGSRDSALMVDLVPGTYSANVTSADGSTGVALVEAYEVTTAGTKITALSTRGYSATDKIMIAGFVVNGAAGTTKRIVIRGQGPNLARLGVPGAMDDPYLELYNSTGDRVMVNDDWALFNVTLSNGNQSSDDFRPLAFYYSEKQISAAGMAPSNRREPCIMVDLPPGLYTAFLKPYQTPATISAPNPPPGSPGVALVEVYEIP